MIDVCTRFCGYKNPINQVVIDIVLCSIALVFLKRIMKCKEKYLNLLEYLRYFKIYLEKHDYMSLIGNKH